MTDTTDAAAAPAATAAEAQAATPPVTPAAPAPAPPVEPAPTVVHPPEIQKLIDDAATKASKSANKEAIAAKSALKVLQDAEDARKTASLSELEQAQKLATDATDRATKAEANAKANALKAAVTAEAVRVGIDPALALKLAGDEVKFDDDGNPTDAATVLDALAVAHPNLISKTPIPTQSPMSQQRSNGGTKLSDAERLAANRAGRDSTATPWWESGGVRII